RADNALSPANDPPTQKIDSDDAERKADVRVEHPKGPKGIDLSDRRLRELLPIKRQGYNLALARLGERNLTNYLQEKGYFFANVKLKCEPVDCSGPTPKVIYDVEPGDRLDLQEIRIEGTDELSKRDIVDQLQTKEASTLGDIPILKSLPLIGGLARGITSNDRLRHDRETIRRRMADFGFRGSRVESRL